MNRVFYRMTVDILVETTSHLSKIERATLEEEVAMTLEENVAGSKVEHIHHPFSVRKNG